MAWTKISDKTMKKALLQAAQLKDAIDAVGYETWNHNERRRMEQLAADAEAITDSLSKINRVRIEHLKKERS